MVARFVFRKIKHFRICIGIVRHVEIESAIRDQWNPRVKTPVITHLPWDQHEQDTHEQHRPICQFFPGFADESGHGKEKRQHEDF